MLKIIDYGSGSNPAPCVFLLGYFDAVHLGHRKLISRAKEIAAEKGLRIGIMTFYDAKQGAQVYVFEERVLLFEKLGIDFVCAADFNGAFKDTPGEKFLDALAGRLNVKEFVAGEDFRFGKDAACDAEDLKKYCTEHGIGLTVLPLLSFDGEKAAASLAKKYLDEGAPEKLAELLGEPYFIRGKVTTEGRHVGRNLGFPTANLHPLPEKYPIKEGVYAVTVQLDGRKYRGIANYGSRPTFGDERIVPEIYIDGFNGDLYGKEIVVSFDFRIRDVKKFASAEELKKQLAKDLEKIR